MLNEKISFAEAQILCAVLGAHIIADESGTEMENLKSAVLPDNYEQDYWLWMNDFKQQGQYVWGTTGEIPNKIKWAESEPNYANEHCVCSRDGWINGTWIDVLCTTFRANVICEHY